MKACAIICFIYAVCLSVWAIEKAISCTSDDFEIFQAGRRAGWTAAIQSGKVISGPIVECNE